MATKLTKEQAAALLAAYQKQQTDATNASIAAYNKTVDADLNKTEAAIAEEQREAQSTADAAYDRATVTALIERRKIAETLSNLGLSRSGTADSANESIERKRTVSERSAREKKQQVLSTLSQRLIAAREQAAAKKVQNTASANKTLKAKIAEKKLTLDKAAL
ncbi:MAG: hypothetical protein IJN61_03835 [Clostridia bacterium]|nr:hypothetical protein [Clostridia bacterium]